MIFVALQRHQKPFLQRVVSHFRAVLRYEDKELQHKALALIPLNEFELAAVNNMRKLQKAIKNGHTNEQEIDIQELILMELLSWFKNSFFSWVDSPECSSCGGTTVFVGHSFSSAIEEEAYRVEVN
jgi:hypothetical protein